MGGGDLNLKKSWHPHTMPNLKKVWEAEQEAEKEKQKLDQLKKEKQREREIEELQKLQEQSGLGRKRNERLDWMYSGASNSATSLQEDYLLGRKKLGTGMGPSPITTKDGVGKFEKPEGSNNMVVAKDIEAKLREDPLFAIKRQEVELTKSVLKNPIQIRKIQSGSVAAKEDEKTRKGGHIYTKGPINKKEFDGGQGEDWRFGKEYLEGSSLLKDIELTPPNIQLIRNGGMVEFDSDMYDLKLGIGLAKSELEGKKERKQVKLRRINMTGVLVAEEAIEEIGRRSYEYLDSSCIEIRDDHHLKCTVYPYIWTTSQD